MAGKRSAEVEKALELAKMGIKGSLAAKLSGIYPSTLYRDAEYKAWRAEQVAKRKIKPKIE